MKKYVSAALIAAASLFCTTNSYAQSWKDLFNKENVENVVNAVTGKNTTVDLTGTWTYTGAAIDFESDNLLAKAGGAVASSTAEKKLNEQLAKVGITPGKLSFTFESDSTFTATLSAKKVKGTYSYDADQQKVQLKFAKIIPLNASVSATSTKLDLLFQADKLLKLITTIAGKVNNSTLNTISSLAGNYDGMQLGVSLEKK
jgi:cytoskeletal protein RodZ